MVKQVIGRHSKATYNVEVEWDHGVLLKELDGDCRAYVTSDNLRDHFREVKVPRTRTEYVNVYEYIDSGEFVFGLRVWSFDYMAKEKVGTEEDTYSKSWKYITTIPVTYTEKVDV